MLKNPLEIYKILPKSNCGRCFLPSCMAFSVAVIKGEKRLEDCQELDSELISQLTGKVKKRTIDEQNEEEVITRIRQKMPTINLTVAASRLGGEMENENLIIKCLGREYAVDQEGGITSECHINPWLVLPLLTYITQSTGNGLDGQWVPFLDLANGPSWKNFYQERCERALQNLLDRHHDLLVDIVSVFGAAPHKDESGADTVLTLYPLPRLPIRVRYWQPEDEFGSELVILFDSTADRHLNVESIYLLTRGLVEMFTRMIHIHA